ncbi:hypothetical protein CCYS_01505 [Corynebacterium cystitidis DSM 20524]|uniref:Pentapeptide repeat-containing protein n=2 Tax=Corynebacterium cystitidis TaxID=35757 RepID=A0A1H9UBI5_9CORY|nr:hypothetical protein CCYS_01505 [Corynebacterium cystitidis DSM 20524]SES06702.1 hypothetical protein SAMN05661109_01772 [Corynebacterium cystitidis DSM 20524]SNV88734.1 Uncharacterised protein [Corynebacterium cystitidis]
MDVELTTRWDRVDGVLDPFVDSSPFGEVDGRQDFRGYVLSPDAPTDFQAYLDGAHVGNCDVSGASGLNVWLEPGCVMENVVADGTHFRLCTAIESELIDCRFVNATLTRSSVFSGSVVRGCVFDGCDAPSIFENVAAVVGCDVRNMHLFALGNGHSKAFTVVEDSVFAVKVDTGLLKAVAGGRQASGCDFSAAQWRHVVFRGVDVSRTKLPAASAGFVVEDFPVEDMIQLAVQVGNEGDERIASMGRTLERMLKRDLEVRIQAGLGSSYTRYCWEADPVGQYGRDSELAREIYARGGIRFDES